MIGVFDSGAGGLCALARLRARLPYASFLYYADTAALPFGEKTPAFIRARILRALAFFERSGADAVLFACGTASSYLPEICKERFTFPIFDIIAPAARAARPYFRTALIATEATVRSGAFAAAVATQTHAPVFSLSCAPLVRMAEGLTPRSDQAVAAVTAPLFPVRPDALILGCTHFSLLKEPLSRAFPRTRLIDAATAAADALCASFAPKRERAPTLRFSVTGDADTFRVKASRVLGEVLAEDHFFCN